MGSQRESLSFCGRQFTGEELSLIGEVVQTCSGISRMCSASLCAGGGMGFAMILERP